ncbi:MAG: hypothetical protein D6798_00510 [Deltaproteobacteria bacterium]|nr:MAG: hypothetical protein D6798_00510 [Deltaproteobacteria bacterium]
MGVARPARDPLVDAMSMPKPRSSRPAKAISSRSTRDRAVQTVWSGSTAWVGFHRKCGTTARCSPTAMASKP